MHPKFTPYSFFVLACFLLSACNFNAPNPEMPSSQPELSSRELMLRINKQIEINPDDADMYFRKSREQLKNGKAKNALLTIAKALELKPDSEPYQLHRIAILLAIKSYDEALGIALELKLLGVENFARLNEYLAEIYFAKNQFDVAQKYVDEAVKINPYDPVLYYRRGVMFQQMNDTAKSEYNLKKALKLNPYHSATIVALSELYQNTGRTKESAEMLDLFDFNDPLNRRFALRRSGLAKEMKEYQLSEDLLHILELQDSTDTKVLVELADLKLSLGQYDSTLVYIKRVQQTEPNNRHSILTEARLLDRQSQYYSARRVYEKLTKSDTTDHIARDELEKLDRKIAYLRRIDAERKERAALPILELKKIE